MKLSIVIPARNEEHYIGRCLDSIYAADAGRGDVEVIVVDNNSTDRTPEVVRRYPQATLVAEPIPGTSRARERGFRESKNDLVAFLDADTALRPEWLPRIEKEFSKDPALVCLSGPYIYYDLPKGINLLVKAFYGISYIIYIVSHTVFGKASVVQGGNYVVRRKALETIGGHNVTIAFYGDDTDVARRMSKVGHVKFSFGFTVYSSGRRLAIEGLAKTALRYTVNYFWMVVRGRPFTNDYKVVREEHPTENLRVRVRDWVVGFATLAAILAVTTGGAYGIYAVAQANAANAFSIVRLLTVAKTEAQEMTSKLGIISAQTKNLIKEKWNVLGQ